MKSKTREAVSRTLLLLGMGLVPSACSYTVLPTSVPAIEESQDVKLAGAAVAIANAETDDAEFLIYRSSRHGSFNGSRKAWCDALVAALSSELTKRGATVAPDAAIRFQLTIPEITGHSGYMTVGFKIRAVVTSADGWTKTYEGDAAAAAGLTMGGIADRSASFAVAEIVKTLLADPVFVSKLAGSKTG